MGMGGGGAGGGEGGKRRGWVTEDSDVWGARDQHAAPGVLGHDPLRDRDDDDDDDERWR